MSDLVHKTRGKHVVYVLACEPDIETGNEIRYVGTTKSCERRVAQHCGILAGGAKWTAEHPPVDIISVRIVDSEEEACTMETMLYQLHASLIGYNYVAGARLNMVQDKKFPPAYFTEEFAGPLRCPKLHTGKEQYCAGVRALMP